VWRGKVDPGWLWRLPKEGLMPLSSNQGRFTYLVRHHVAVIPAPASFPAAKAAPRRHPSYSAPVTNLALCQLCAAGQRCDQLAVLQLVAKARGLLISGLARNSLTALHGSL
jgi:hypothetical protein